MVDELLDSGLTEKRLGRFFKSRGRRECVGRVRKNGDSGNVNTVRPFFMSLSLCAEGKVEVVLV